MPRNINAARFNKICELNFRATPITGITCGQFIIACQQTLVSQEIQIHGQMSNLEIIRATNKHVAEKIIKPVKNITRDRLTFDKLVADMIYHDVPRIAALCIESIRKGL
jgi:hypothetical protein